MKFSIDPFDFEYEAEYEATTENAIENINESEDKLETNSTLMLRDTPLKGPSTILSRWRRYVIEVTAVHPQGGTNAILKLDLNTYRWDCKDNRGTSITQTQFCDGHEDCPNGRDENENICQVSQLPKKLSYLFYVYMLLFIWVYFTLLRDERPESVGQNIAMVAKQSFKKCLYQREESDFKAIYVENHQFGPNFEKFCGEVKFEMYQNPASMEVTLKWVREIEEELHGEAEEIYNCINTNFGGSHYLTTRIVDPEGGVFIKISSKINQMMLPRRIGWYFLSNFIMFIMLCLHMFDYVKDIGETFSLVFICQNVVFQT